MDIHSVHGALRQALENYKRCGLSRFVRSSELLPASTQAAIVAWKARQRTLPDFESGSLSERVPNAAGLDEADKLASGERVHSSQPAGSASGKAALLTEGDQGAAGKWSLPILDIDQRRQRFDILAEEAAKCRLCTEIVNYRQQTVFGDGTLSPTVCFVGEAPGADEDRLGKPFVGKAGQLLTKIIEAMKLRREEVYILNALKCRPPQNRTPMQEEIDHCHHFVESQLETLQPKFIVCLGAVAVRTILQSQLSVGKLRGEFHNYRGARVLVTYHPSYLLRNEGAKRLVWEDMKMLMKELE